MKIEGLVAARERDSRYFIWSSTDTEQHISVGTDVTVEWDDRSEMTLTEIANVIEETSSDYEAICEAVRMLRKHAGRSEGVHQCKLANELSRRMGKHQGKWYVMELWRGRRGECLLEDISHCPFCGEKLP